MKGTIFVLIFLTLSQFSFGQQLDYYRLTLKQEHPLVYQTISDDAFERCSDDALKYGNEVEIQAYCFLQIHDLIDKCPEQDIKGKLGNFRWNQNENIEYAYQTGRVDWVEAYQYIFNTLIDLKHSPLPTRGKVNSL